LKGFWGMVRGNFSLYKNQHALKLLSEPAPHGPATLVKIEAPARSLEETRA
jgi:hypothetical protein